MKISNETKVGAIVAISIAVLILGFNFLKGKKLFSKSTTLYGKYKDIQGLQNSNPVQINGMQVGTVYNITPSKDMRDIVVEFNITKDIMVPQNSIAIIKPNPVGITSVEIKLGDTNVYMKNKDTLVTEANAGVFMEIMKKVDPVLYEVRKAVSTLDSLVSNVNTVIDPRAKENISAMLSNMNKVSESLITTTASLNAMLNQQTGALAKTLENANAITGNLAANNQKINGVISNISTTTEKFSKLDVQKTFNTLDAAVTDFKTMMGKLDNPNGTLGKLVNDPTLYQNLASTGNKLNLLLDDIRINPKRYINISLIGKKQKNDPVMVPLPDTINSPYYIEKVKADH
ncbi:MAG: MlaD family protein [Ferruginibacter sp.]